jgi:hypothetical protein
VTNFIQKCWVLLGLLLGLLYPVVLQGQKLVWEESYGSQYRDQAKAAVTVGPRHQVVFGHMHRDAQVYPVPTKLYLIKLDTAGRQQWVRNFEFDGLVRAGDLLKLPDGGFLITATLRQPDQYHHLLWKLDETGRPLWKKRREWKPGTPPMLLNHSTKGGYCLVGPAQPSHEHVSSQYKGLIVERVDSNGEVQFRNTLGYEDILQPVSFGRLDAAHYYIIAKDASGMPLFLKIESLDGQLLADFIRPVDLDLKDYQSVTLRDACKVASGHFLLAGSGIEDQPREEPQPNAWLCRLNQQAERIWRNVYNKARAQMPLTVMTMPGSGFVVGGYQGEGRVNHVPEEQEAWLTGTSFNGRQLWEKAYGSKKVERISLLTPIPKSAEYLAYGRTARRVRKGKPARSDWNLWRAKFDTTGFYQPRPVGKTNRISPEYAFPSLGQLIAKIQAQPNRRALNRLLYRYRLIADPEGLSSGSGKKRPGPFKAGQLSIDTFRKNLFGDQQQETVLQLRSPHHYVINVFYEKGNELHKVPGRISTHFSERHRSTDFVFYFKTIAKPETYEIATQKSWQYRRSDNERVTFYDVMRDTLRPFHRVATQSFSYSGLRTYLHDTKRSLNWHQKEGYPKQLVVQEEAEHKEDMKRKPSGGKVVSGRTTKASIRRVIHFEKTPIGLKLSRIKEDISRTVNVINPDSGNDE